MLLILQRLLEGLNDNNNLSIEHLKELKDYSGNIYTALNIIAKEKLFFYISTFIIIMLIAHYMQIELKHLFAFILAIVIIYFLIQKDTKEQLIIDNEYKEKLEFINNFLFINKPYHQMDDSYKTGIIYTPPNDVYENYLIDNKILFNFMYDIRDYAELHPVAYAKILRHCNNLVKIRIQMLYGTVNCGNFYEIAQNEKIRAVNNFMSIVYRIPSTRMSNKKFINDTKIFKEIVQAEVDFIYKICKEAQKNSEITIDTPNLDQYVGPVPNPIHEKEYSDHFNLIV